MIITAITDPGAGLTEVEATAARIAAWKMPTVGDLNPTTGNLYTATTATKAANALLAERLAAPEIPRPVTAPNVWLVTTDPLIFGKIVRLPDIAGGPGPVAIGVPLAEPEGVKDRRFAVCHPFGILATWAEAYARGAITVLPSLPKDWRYPVETPTKPPVLDEPIIAGEVIRK